nr:GNAT family protein [Streptomyces sp. I05A-00742]
MMFVDFDAALGVCEIGCRPEPAGERHGLVTKVCGALPDRAFTTRGPHRAEWNCRADNKRSSAMAERLGMTMEGVRRGYRPYDGARHDREGRAARPGSGVPAGSGRREWVRSPEPRPAS